MKKYLAEMIGTMILVLMGCGSAVFAGGIAQTVGAGTGTLGVALAFGLSVVAMAYTIGNISGCHINPAITLAMWLSRRIGSKSAMFYMFFQVVGGILGALILAILTSTGGHGGPTLTGANTFDSGEGWQAFIAETVFTFIFVLVVLASTDEKKWGRQPGRPCHRSYAGAHPHRLHPHHRDFGQSGTKHRSGSA